MPQIQFVAAGGTISLETYFSSDSGDIVLYQPVEVSTGADKIVFDSTNRDNTRDLSLSMLPLSEKDDIINFFDNIVDGMAESFLLREYYFFTTFRFDSTLVTMDSNSVTMDSDHVYVGGDYRFNSPALDIIENNNYHNVSFTLLRV